MDDYSDRLGPYMETLSGKRFYFLDPRLEDIDINDIAASLANICRFNGHTLFYSVAEHSCYVAAQLPEEHRLEGLLHDAAEAYVGDVASPLKSLLPDYKNMEKNIIQLIYKKFGIESTKESRKLVKEADLEQLRKEAFYLMPSAGRDYNFGDTDVHFLEEDDGDTLRIPRCVSPRTAYIMFKEAYRVLTEVDQLVQEFNNNEKE